MADDHGDEAVAGSGQDGAAAAPAAASGSEGAAAGVSGSESPAAAGAPNSEAAGALNGDGVGSVIRGVRKALGLSREEVSTATGESSRGKPVRAGKLRRIEADDKKPSTRDLTSLAYALGIEDPELEAAADRLFTATGGQSVRKQVQSLAIASSGISATGALGLAPGVGVADSAAAMTTLRQQNREFRDLAERAFRARLSALRSPAAEPVGDDTPAADAAASADGTPQ